MKPLILVHNFSEEDFSLSKFNNFFNSVSEKAKITDVVLFFPCGIRASEGFLMELANYASYCSPNTHFDFFIDESYYEDLPFEFFEYLRRMNPNFHLHSKEDGVYIGEHYFKWFDLNKEFALDEVKFYPNDNIKGIKKTFVVSSKKEEVFLKRISKKYSCVSRGESEVFVRRYSRDYVYNKQLLNCEMDDYDSNIYSSKHLNDDKIFDIGNDNKNIKEQADGRVLKLVPRKNRNGKKNG